MSFSKKRSTHLALFFQYLANAAYATYLYFHPGSWVPHQPALGVLVPEFLGVCLLLLLIPIGLKRTSIPMEKAAVLLTEALFVIGFVTDFHELGVSWAVVPFGDPLFDVMSCAAAVLVGAQTLEVLRNGCDETGP